MAGTYATRQLIPPFICRQAMAGRHSGFLQATVLYADMSGFTGLTRRLAEQGNEGAEILSALLNHYFGAIERAVLQHHGFIAMFAGDALYGLFPAARPAAAALRAAAAIRTLFVSQGRRQTRFGACSFGIKIGLAHGAVAWGIIPSSPATYYFRGQAVTHSLEAEKLAQNLDIIIHHSLQMKLAKQACRQVAKQFYHVTVSPVAIRDAIANNHTACPAADRFLPAEVVQLEQAGEFRRVTSLFMALDLPAGYAATARFLTRVRQTVARYGGYFYSIQIAAYGAYVPVFFGAPGSKGDDTARAAECMLQLKQQLPGRIRAGMDRGMVFAGFIGGPAFCYYTCMGHSVNLSARLMALADWDELHLSHELYQVLLPRAEGQDRGTHTIKGLTQPMRLVNLTGFHRQAVTVKRVFTGREQELRNLQNQCKPLFDHQFAGLVYLYGEAGIGKTQTVQHLLQTLGQRVHARVLPTDIVSASSLHPFVSLVGEYFLPPGCQDKKQCFAKRLALLRDMLSTKGTRGQDINRDLRHRQSLLAELAGIAPEHAPFASLPPDKRFAHVVLAIKTLIRALSLIKPLLVVIEDIQYLDPASKQALTVITTNMGPFPVLFLFTSRLADNGARPVIGLDPSIRRLELLLKGLTPAEINHLVEALTGHPPAPGLHAFLAERTKGNPLFLEHMLLYLREKNALQLEKKQWHLVGSVHEIPAAMHAILLSRLDCLPKELKDITQLAAVLGREFDLATLQAMFTARPEPAPGILPAVSEHQLLDWLRQGEQLALWIQKRPGVFHFRPLVRQSAYNMQLKHLLRTRHLLAAEAIRSLQSGGQQCANIALHYDQADCSEQAVSFLEKAIQYAADSYHNHEALRLIERRLRHNPDADQRASLLARQVDILLRIGKWDNAESLINTGLELSQTLGDIHLNLEFALKKGNLLINRGSFKQAENFLQNVLRSDEITSYQDIRIRFLNQLGTVTSNQGNTTAALRYHQQALALLKQHKNEKKTAESLQLVSTIYYARNEWQKALSGYQEALSIYQSYGSRWGQAMVWNNIGLVYSMQHQEEKALDCFKKALAINEEIGTPKTISANLTNIASLYNTSKQSEAALYYLEQALAIDRELGDRRGIAVCLDHMGDIFYDQRDYKAAYDYYARAFRLYREIGFKKGMATSRFSIARIYYQQEKYQQALDTYRETRKIFEAIHSPLGQTLALENMAIMHKALGHFQEFFSCITQAIREFRQLDYKWGLASSLLQLAEYRLRQGQCAAAREHYRVVHDLGLEIKNDTLARQSCLGMAQTAIKNLEGRQAEQWSQQALAYAYQTGDKEGTIKALGFSFLARGLEAAAAPIPVELDKAFDLARELNHQGLLNWLHYLIAGYCIQHEQFADARSRVEQILASGRELPELPFMFNCRLLSARLTARHDPRQAEQDMLALLPAAHNSVQQAAVYALLARITGKADYLDQAITRYQALAVHGNCRGFAKKLASLKELQQSPRK